MTEQKIGLPIEEKLPEELKRKRDELLKEAKRKARIARLRKGYAERREKKT